MNRKNVLTNAVCIGKFNPGILNLNFLKENNIYIPKEEVSKPVITPFMVNLKYDDLEFFIEIERFQITKINIEEEFKDDAIKIMYNYLRILEFTPISLIGINFISDVSINNLEKLIENLENDKNITDTLKTKEFLFVPRIRKHEKGYEYLNWNIEVKQTDVKDLVKRIIISKQDKDKFRISSNFEIKNIKNYKDLSYFIENFEKMKEEHTKIIINFFGD